jgi:hypothetical protein
MIWLEGVVDMHITSLETISDFTKNLVINLYCFIFLDGGCDTLQIHL